MPCKYREGMSARAGERVRMRERASECCLERAFQGFRARVTAPGMGPGMAPGLAQPLAGSAAQGLHN